jgi:hypothetical protein
MSKLMFVTVGTSLFHSATWEATPEVLSCAPGYGDWLTKDAVGSPEARQRGERAARTRAGLMEHLAVENVSEWAERLALDLLADPPRGPAMRYSAELATLLKMHEEGEESPSFRDFLRGYERINLVFERDHDAGGQPNASRVAGEHLVGYLNRLAGFEVAVGLPIRGLSSTDPARLIGGGGGFGDGALQRLAEELEKVRRPGVALVDLVISGGYKLYGVALARLAEESKREPIFRLVYVHEMGDRLMTYARGSIGMARHWSPNPVSRLSDRESLG